MMKDLMLSPESQKSKTISLVVTLDKKIKAHPGCLFRFITILLDSDNPLLQKCGKELLRETGKNRLK